MEEDYNFCAACGTELEIVKRNSPFNMYLWTYKQCPKKNINGFDIHYIAVIKSEPIGNYDPITGKLRA